MTSAALYSKMPTSSSCLYALFLIFLLTNLVLAQQQRPVNVTTNSTNPVRPNVTATTPTAISNTPAFDPAQDTPQCTKPFVLDPKYATGGVSNEEACQLGCCIPCPQHYYYYAEGALDKGFRITTSMRAVSAVATLVLIVSYLFLPNKRNHPALLILFSALAIFLFSSSSFFGLADPKKIQCSDAFTQATQDNNGLCLVQGMLSTFGSHATAAWLAVLILNMHLHTVWNSQVLQRKYVFLHLVCWGLPFALTAITVAKGAIRYEFGESCVVGHEHAETLFFFPMFALVVPAFLIHLCTFFYIGKVSLRARQTNFDHKRSSMGGMLIALRIQWRALALAVSLITSVIIFSFFYFQIVVRLNDTFTNQSKLAPWAKCILSGGDQTTCAEAAAPVFPTPAIMFAAESAISAMGIIFFLLFVVQKQFLRDWKNLIAGHKRRKDIKFLDKLEQREMEERAWEERRHKRETSHPEPANNFALYRASEEQVSKDYSYY
jgi:hypothetical protein